MCLALILCNYYYYVHNYMVCTHDDSLALKSTYSIYNDIM